MESRVVTELATVSAADWDGLRGPDHNPFLSHAFLSALERHGCVGEAWGWLPRHVVVYQDGRLLGGVPLYLKHNSYGELVFDWAWAEAYKRAGLRYYPKLVAGVPYSPVTGPRLLLHPQADPSATRTALIARVDALAEEIGVSSVHWLFAEAEEIAPLAEAGYFPRNDCQFHWHNRGYRDFDDFLDGFTAEKRKKLRRERRQVTDQGLAIEIRHGQEVSTAEWSVFHEFYRDTFDRRGGWPTLTADFFAEIGERLRERVVMVFARHGRDLVAGALSLRSGEVLYGRHWGCRAEFNGLHFEACYYTGIEYCIRHGLARFEPGAQGEHKVGRGFEPTLTHSAHRLADPRFQRAISGHVAREREMVDAYLRELETHLPFKAGGSRR